MNRNKYSCRNATNQMRHHEIGNIPERYDRARKTIGRSLRLLSPPSPTFKTVPVLNNSNAAQSPLHLRVVSLSRGRVQPSLDGSYLTRCCRDEKFGARARTLRQPISIVDFFYAAGGSTLRVDGQADRSIDRQTEETAIGLLKLLVRLQAGRLAGWRALTDLVRVDLLGERDVVVRHDCLGKGRFLLHLFTRLELCRGFFALGLHFCHLFNNSQEKNIRLQITY